MRVANRALVLRMVWERCEVSRADIARETKLARSTVSALVSDLINAGLVEDRGAGHSRGGRRPILVGFRDDAFTLLGVSMGASHITVALTDLRGKVLDASKVSLDVRNDVIGAIETMFSLVDALLDGQPGARERLVGAGLAVPSPVSPDASGRLSALILPAWRNTDPRSALEKHIGRPVWIDNDANLGALAEAWYGDDPGNDLVYLKVATGIGAGYFLRGEIYRGARGTAGEVGHTFVDPAGGQCVCGLTGCLVTLAGSGALLRATRERLTPASGSPPSSRLHGGDLDLDRLIEAAIAGDPVASEVMADAGRYLGVAVANILNLLCPSRVVLGGSITQAGDRLLEPLVTTIAGRTPLTSREVPVVISTLGLHAIARGAAMLVLQNALRDIALFPALRDDTTTTFPLAAGHA